MSVRTCMASSFPFASELFPPPSSLPDLAYQRETQLAESEAHFFDDLFGFDGHGSLLLDHCTRDRRTARIFLRVLSGVDHDRATQERLLVFRPAEIRGLDRDVQLSVSFSVDLDVAEISQVPLGRGG